MCERDGIDGKKASPAPRENGACDAVRRYDLYRCKLLKEKYEHEQSERSERRER